MNDLHIYGIIALLFVFALPNIVAKLKASYSKIKSLLRSKPMDIHTFAAIEQSADMRCEVLQAELQKVFDQQEKIADNIEGLTEIITTALKAGSQNEEETHRGVS